MVAVEGVGAEGLEALRLASFGCRLTPRADMKQTCLIGRFAPEGALATGLTSPRATFSAHTASPPRLSRTPAGSRASGRHTWIVPRTALVRGPPAWDGPRTRT